MKLNAQTLRGFSDSVLKKGFDSPVATPQVHMEWWDACCGLDKLVAIAAPRRCAKSTAITHSYTLASMLFRERKYALIVSDTFAQACQFLADIKQELTVNEDITTLFQIDSISKDTEDDIIVNFEDGQRFRIQARGAEQKLRGLKWDGKRPDLIVCDDMENDEMVMNRDRRMKLKRWFYSTLLPCLSPRGIVRVVGTILHLDSLLESFMPESVAGPTRQRYVIQEELKQYFTGRGTWKSYKYKAHNEDFSKLLWPDMWSKEKLIALREDYIRQGLPDVYSQEMLNVPLDEERTFFKRKDFLPLGEKEKEKDINCYIAADLAISQNQQADYTVFVVGGTDDEGFLQIRNVIRDRLDSAEIVETIFSLYKMYEPIMIALEDGQIAKSLDAHLRAEMMRRNEFVPIKLVPARKDKMQRAQSIKARMRAGGVKFDKNAEWFYAFEDELTKFPRVKHDDQVDAFAHLGSIIDKMIDPPTEEQIQEDEWEQEYKKDNMEGGRDITTGY